MINRVLREISNKYNIEIINRDDDTIDFHVKEIKGFRFALWNQQREKAFGKEQFQKQGYTYFDYIGVHNLTEVVFFVQYEKDLDKFKPSRSGFAIGAWEENGYNHGVDSILNAMGWIRKNKLKARYVCGMETNKIWNCPSLFYCIKQNLKRFFADLSRNIKMSAKEKILILKAKRLAKVAADYKRMITIERNNIYVKCNLYILGGADDANLIELDEDTSEIYIWTIEGNEMTPIGDKVEKIIKTYEPKK